MNTYGSCRLALQFSSNHFEWSFLLANVSMTILGSDLHHNHLLVDVAGSASLALQPWNLWSPDWVPRCSFLQGFLYHRSKAFSPPYRPYLAWHSSVYQSQEAGICKKGVCSYGICRNNPTLFLSLGQPLTHGEDTWWFLKALWRLPPSQYSNCSLQIIFAQI